MTPVGGIVRLGQIKHLCLDRVGKMVLLYMEEVSNMTIDFRWTINFILSGLCDSKLWVN